MNDLVKTTQQSDDQIARDFAKRLERGIRQFNKFFDVKYWGDCDEGEVTPLIVALPFTLPLRMMSGHFAINPFRRNMKVACVLKYTKATTPYYEFSVNADIGAISYLGEADDLEHIHQHLKKSLYPKNDNHKVASISDVTALESSTFTTGMVQKYVEKIQTSISKEKASIGKNIKHSEHMLQICALLVEDPDTDLTVLARIFRPEKSLVRPVKKPLEATPIDIQAETATIETAKQKLSTQPTDADIISFGMDIGHTLRTSNKAVTDWRQQNGLDLPLSFQLHKRLAYIVSDIQSEDLPAEQKLAVLNKSSALITQMIEHLPLDQAAIRQDMHDNGVAKSILQNNAEIARSVCDAFNDAVSGLKAHTHKIGQDDRKTFDDAFIDSHAQDLTLMRHTYNSKEVGHDQIETPALRAMAMNLNKMGTVLDLIIDNIESARREITAKNMSAANKILRKMATRVTTLGDIVQESETVIKAITDGTSTPLQITHQPLGTNGDSNIQLAHITRVPQ